MITDPMTPAVEAAAQEAGGDQQTYDFKPRAEQAAKDARAHLTPGETNGHIHAFFEGRCIHCGHGPGGAVEAVRAATANKERRRFQ